MMKYLLVLLYVLWGVVRDSIEEDSKRPKRVVNGFEMLPTQKDHYKALEYFTWIGETWNCAEDVSWFVRWGFAAPDGPGRGACFEKPSHTQCGGTLIAPRIVQTACHCFAQSTLTGRTDRIGPPWVVPMILDVSMREKYQIYMGFVHTNDMVWPVPSENVHIHQKCGVMTNTPGYFRYDFAWITLKHPVAEGRGVISGQWGRQLDYAGPYLKSALDLDYNKVLGQMQVCMVMGYGDPGIRYGPSVFFERMTHGYIQTMDPYSCHFWLVHSITALPSAHQQTFHENYDNMISWMCAKRLAPLQQGSGIGDSGSPVTCNGQYFALISQGVTRPWEIFGVKTIEIDSALKFAPEANTVEHRAGFEEEMLMPPSPSQWWTNKPDLRRLGLGKGRLMRYPDKQSNSSPHSMEQHIRNRAMNANLHAATFLYFISMRSFGRIRHK